jgi:hypothetical protein
MLVRIQVGDVDAYALQFLDLRRDFLLDLSLIQPTGGCQTGK